MPRPVHGNEELEPLPEFRLPLVRELELDWLEDWMFWLWRVARASVFWALPLLERVFCERNMSCNTCCTLALPAFSSE